MILLNAAQSRELDRIAVEDIGIPEDALMENAGQAVVTAMQRQWGSLQGKRVAILCGKGRNGTDALVAARHLLNEGVNLWILIACPEGEMSATCARQARILSSLGLV